MIDLMAQGIIRALDDCGLGLKDVDGLLCATTQSRTSGLNLSEYLGISPAFIDTTIIGGSSFMFHVAHALAALQTGAVQSRGHRLRLDPAQHRPAPGLGARDQPLRDAVPPVPALDRLCAGRLAPHARIRHDPRADGRGRGRGARMGAAQPGRVGEKAADDRRGARRAHGQLPVHGARHLPRHRRRRRDRADRARARQGRSKSRRSTCSAAARRSPTPTSRRCPT